MNKTGSGDTALHRNTCQILCIKLSDVYLLRGFKALSTQRAEMEFRFGTALIYFTWWWLLRTRGLVIFTCVVFKQFFASHKWMSPVQLMKMFTRSSSCWEGQINNYSSLPEAVNGVNDILRKGEFCLNRTKDMLLFYCTAGYVSYFIAYCKYIIVCIISKFKMLSSSSSSSLHYISMRFILPIYNCRQFLGHGLSSVIQSSMFCHEYSSKLSPFYWILSRSCGSWKLFFADDRADLGDGAAWVWHLHNDDVCDVNKPTNALKQCQILPHTRRGEKKQQIQGIWVGVYEKNTKTDRVWGTA